LLAGPADDECADGVVSVDAEAALAAGLVNEVVPGDQLETRVGAVAERIASNAPLTLQITKESIRRLRERTRPEGGDDLVALAYTSADFHEGVDAFLAKRPPVWRGR
ncbi:MAG: hypothetical protein HY329_16225, partial [Chloroflexi bacterium]|nr:hypothetical protein [Chloroflexota bacterium]